MQRLMRNKGKKFTRDDEAQVSFENIKRERCEAPVLGMPTEKDVGAGHGCISGCDIGHTSPGAGVERENSSSSDSLRE